MTFRNTNSNSSVVTAALMVVSVAFYAAAVPPAHAFVSLSPSLPEHATRTQAPLPSTPCSLYPNNRRPRDILQMAATVSDNDMKGEISAMKAKEIREELESYGISTKSFFEKSELEEALLKARKEGKTIVDSSTTRGSSTSTTFSTTGSSNSAKTTENRHERIQQEIEKCKNLKVAELKKELEDAGVSTKSFFEKSEFVRAVAETRVDGPKKSASSRTSSGRVEDDPRDPSYRDVVVSKFQGGKGMLGGGFIDVKAR